MNRRELLKLFGIGAAVVPIVGGAPQLAAESKLVTVPKVEPVVTSVKTAQAPLGLREHPGPWRMQVTYRANGQAYYFEADTFIDEISYSLMDVSSFDSPYGRECFPVGVPRWQM